MKDYTAGLIRHRCSNLMRIGKPIKIHKRGARDAICPNCKKKVQVYVTDKFYHHIFAVRSA